MIRPPANTAVDVFKVTAIGRLAFYEPKAAICCPTTCRRQAPTYRCGASAKREERSPVSHFLPSSVPEARREHTKACYSSRSYFAVGSAVRQRTFSARQTAPSPAFAPTSPTPAQAVILPKAAASPVRPPFPDAKALSKRRRSKAAHTLRPARTEARSALLGW